MTLEFLHDAGFLHQEPLFLTLLVLSMGPQINGGHLRLILLARQLSILETVLLVSQSDAEKTILTANAIFQEGARCAIDAVLATPQSIAVMDVDAVITELTVKIVKTVDARDVLFESIAVHTVLTEIGMAKEIAILARPSEVDVVRVLDLSLDIERHCGYPHFEFSNLRKDRPSAIDLLSKPARIPPITVPTLTTVIGFTQIRGILRQRPLAAEAALPSIEIHFVVLTQPSLLAAIGAVRRSRNVVGLSIEDRGDGRIEGQVVIGDLKPRRAVGADRRHGSIDRIKLATVTL